MNQKPTRTTLDNVPYIVLDKWWMRLIEDGRFLCAQEALPVFPLDHDGTAKPEDRFRVRIEWRQNGIKKQIETRAKSIDVAMADMWRRWALEGLPL